MSETAEAVEEVKPSKGFTEMLSDALSVAPSSGSLDIEKFVILTQLVREVYALDGRVFDETEYFKEENFEGQVPLLDVDFDALIERDVDLFEELLGIIDSHASRMVLVENTAISGRLAINFNRLTAALNSAPLYVPHEESTVDEEEDFI